MTEIPKMGRAAVDSNTLLFEDWRVPTTDLIGSEGDGFKRILYGMNAERILIAGEAIGLGFAALRRAANYAANSEQNIGRNQHPLADIWVRLEAARLLVNQAARCTMRASMP